MIITNSRYTLVGYFITSHPTRAHGIIVISPTSASGIIVLLKMPPKYRKLDYNKNKKAQKNTHTLAIFVDHGIMAHIGHDGLANENSRIALSNDPVLIISIRTSEKERKKIQSKTGVA